ncbi:MAG: AbrB/MazE/SpoVT family DNA-binding domain-containing protein [Clostridiales bacterium]|nr:AbrB/MazE/SpoVT family DNA-binding domain-containing protein [Clostridiales bacterium]
MQKSNNEIVESVLIGIPADLLEEVGIEPDSTIQMSVSRGRIIIEPVDEEESTFHQRCPHVCCCEGCRG